MKDCLLYKYIVNNFKKQVLTFALVVALSVIFLLVLISGKLYASANLGIIVFFLLIISFASLVLQLSFRGKKSNIEKLKQLISSKNFDEVIFESTNKEFIKSRNFVIEKVPYLLFIKNKQKIVFQIMFNSKDFNGIFSFVKELSENKNVKYITKVDKDYNSSDETNLLIPDVA